MAIKKKGHFRIHGSSGIITVPAGIIKDSSFPLKDGYKVMIEIKGGRLVVTPLERFEHFNTYEDHVTIYDNKLGTHVDIYFNSEGVVWCDCCHKTKCEHIEFALSIPEVVKPLREKGWKIGK